MSIGLKIIVIAAGVLLIVRTVSALKRKEMSESQSVLWLVGGGGLIVLGLFTGILKWLAQRLDVWWAPSLVFFVVIVIMAFILFNHTKEITALRAEVAELSMQLTILKHEQDKEREREGSDT